MSYLRLQLDLTVSRREDRRLSNFTRRLEASMKTIKAEAKAIWHLAPLPVHADELHALIILPECTYANDCTVFDLKDDERFEIVL